MSTQQIPSVAQLAAARLLLWHQNSPSVAPAANVAEAADVAASEAEREVTAAGDNESIDEAHEDVDVSDARGEEGPEPSGEQDAAADELEEGEAAADHDGDESEELEAADALDGDSEDGELEDPDDDDDEDLDGDDDLDDEDLADEDSDETQDAPATSVAVLTLESAREFVQRAGLLLFRPMPQMALAPAPSFAEATLGEHRESPSLAETETARGLLMRMVGEGTAVPLNLLGAPGTTGEQPDFVVTTSAFPYIFTLRGDKNWKQLPGATGANKVSPLAVNAYAMLLEQGPQSAAALTNELGKGLTETAVLRALSELWQQLRVLPVPQSNGKPTLWEPITSRFAKQIKAGANAGLPTALSALISLYLGQALLATEEEVATFLSPLAPRSRVREVLHGLLAAQQLEEMVIDGKQHVALVGELPVFEAPVATRRPVTAVGARGESARGEGDGRIKRFTGADRGAAGDRTKPFRPRSEGRPPFKGGKAGGARFGGGDRFSRGGDRPARTGDRSAAGGSRQGGEGFRPEKRFDRPWEDDRARRPEQPRPAGDAEGETPRPERAFRPPAGGSRPPFERKGGFAGKPRFDGERPAFNRERSFDRGQDRPARPRPPFAGRQGQGEGFAAGGDSFPLRAPRREFGGPPRGDRPGADRPRFDRSSSDRPRFERTGTDRPRFDREGTDRPAFDRPKFGGPKPGGARFGGSKFGGKPFGGPKREDAGGAAGPRAPWSGPREGARPFGGDRREMGDRARGGFSRPDSGGRGGDSRDGNGGERPPFRRFDAPKFDRPRSDRPQFGGPKFGGPKFGGSRSDQPREARPFGDRATRGPGSETGRGGAGAGFGPRPGFKPRPGGASPRPERAGFGPRSGGADRAPRGDRPAGAGSFKPRGSGGPKSGSPFEKFVGGGKGGVKPWGKRPPPRKIKPTEDEG